MLSGLEVDDTRQSVGDAAHAYTVTGSLGTFIFLRWDEPTMLLVRADDREMLMLITGCNNNALPSTRELMVWKELGVFCRWK